MGRYMSDHEEEKEVRGVDELVVASRSASHTSQLDDLLNEKLEQALDKPSIQLILHEITKIAMEYDPVDLAHAAIRLPRSARAIIYENLPDLHAKIIFITNTGSSTRAAIFSQIDDQEIRTLLDKMPPHEAVWILDDMSHRRVKKVLGLMEPTRAARIHELYEHGSNSAGRLMTDEFFSFSLNVTVGEVASVIRDNPGIDLTRRIFVLSDSGELVGFVPARNLIVNPFHVSVRQVMKPILHKIHVDASRDEAVDLVERYKIPALPVIDEQERLVGVITYEKVVEALEEIADETIASFAGTTEDISEHQPTLQRFLGRAPWLIVTLCAGFVTATVLSHFKDRHWFNFVALFVPLIAGMSGNVGIQCSTVLVRGMSTGELSQGARKAAMLSELCIGLLIGLVFGCICGSFVYVLNRFDIHSMGSEPLMLGAIVSCGLFGACMVATLLGTFSPFFLARFRVDPAIASGPIVTAFNDVSSTLMYILVAKTISSFFNYT